MDIKNRIIEYVKNNAGTTYVEIERIFDEHDFQWKGENIICSQKNKNVILWSGWNDTACNLMNELQSENLIKKEVSNAFCYVVDGKTLDLPIVKSSHDYKTEHWLPIEFTLA